MPWTQDQPGSRNNKVNKYFLSEYFWEENARGVFI